MRTQFVTLVSVLFLFFGLMGLNSAFAMEVHPSGIITQPAQGVFAGSLEDRLVHIGGYKAGEEYLRSIRILERDAKGTYHPKESKTELPKGIAFGATITLPDGLVILGGRGTEGPVSACYRILWSQQKKDVECVPFPELPFPVAEAAGDYFQGRLWLCGKKTDGSSFLISFNIQDKTGNESTWRQHAPVPGFGRKGAAVVIGNDSRGKSLFVCGGVSADNVPVEPRFCVFHFGDESWSVPKVTFPEDFPTVGTTAFRSGTIHLLFTGGRNAITDKTTSCNVWAYNTITDQLICVRKLAEPSCDVPAIQVKGEIILPVQGKGTQAGQVELITLLPAEKNNRLGMLNMGLFIAYFLFLAWMGWSFLKRMKGAEDFFRAGHRIPWWAVGISIYGTITSAITYITVPAKSFMTDWKLLLLGFGPLIAVPILSRWYIPRLSRFDFTSAYEYLEYRFHPLVRFLGSLTFIVFQISRIAILLFLPAIAFHSITGIDMTHCILAVGITGILCTLVGGIEIVIWIEVFQVLILLVGFVLTIGVVIFKYDGSIMEMFRIAYENGKLTCIEPAFNFRIDSVWTVILASFFLYLIPYASDQTILQRYFTGRNTSDRQRGVWISAGLAIPNILLLFILGTLFYVFYRSRPEALPIDFANNDALMPWFFITQLPDGISGILLLALMTSAISSVSSGINAISAAYTIDFHERLFHFSKKNAVQVARIVTLISGMMGVCFALVLATWDISSLWDQYNVFIGLISSGLAGLFLLGIFTTRANTPGIVLGMIASGYVQYLMVRNGTVHFLLYSGTGVVTTMLFGYLASLLFPSQTKILATQTQDNLQEEKAL